MSLKRSPEEQRLRTLHAMDQMGINVQSVWIRYFSIGGDLDEFELHAYLHGVLALPSLDRNLISHAVNELINETPRPAAPYNDETTTNSRDSFDD